MERCTEWRGEHAAVMAHNVNYVDRLARYEDTGLEPDEIQEAVDLVTFSGADIPQELKRWVERCTWHVRKCDQLHAELDRVKKELSELHTKRAAAEELTGRWISVDDRLPEKDGEYLVSIHQEDDEIGLAGDLVIPAWYQTCPLLFVPKSIGWHLLNEFYEFSDRMRDDITHWMPMPEPPEKE